MQRTITFFDTDVEAEALELPPGLLARFLRYAERMEAHGSAWKRMEVHGPDLGMPHTRAMGGGLFEMRLKAKEGIARVFYCTMIDQRVVILHQFVKKSRKTPRKELEIAHRRLKEVNNAW